jgi:flagellar motor component MotA
MKKLLGIVLILIVGIIIGYVFHDPIDSKLKAKFGETFVENTNTAIEKGGKKAGKVTKQVVKKTGENIKEAVDSVKEK